MDTLDVLAALGGLSSPLPPLDVLEALGGLSMPLDDLDAEEAYWLWIEDHEPPQVPVHVAISRVMADVGRVGKLGVNTSGRREYTFKRVEDIYAAVHDSAIRHGVLVMPHKITVEEQREVPTTYADSGKTILGTSVRVRIVYRWTGPMGDKMHSQGLGEGYDTSDKASSKATQQAMKYALIQALQIADAEGVDGDQTTIEKSYQADRAAVAAAPGRAFDDALTPTLAAYRRKGWDGDAAELEKIQAMVETQRDLVKRVLHKDTKGVTDEERAAIRTRTAGAWPPDRAKFDLVANALDPVVRRLSEDQPDMEPVPAPQVPPEGTADEEADPTSTAHVIGVDPASVSDDQCLDPLPIEVVEALQAAVEMLDAKAHVMFQRWATKFGVEIGPRMSGRNAEAAGLTVAQLRGKT